MKKVVFVDRDGTIIREPRDRQIDSLEKLEFVPGIIRGLRLLVDSGFTLIMVSNQDGLGSAGYPRAAYEKVQKKIIRLLSGEGICFERVLICPHLPADLCECRKPNVGLIKSYLRKMRDDCPLAFVLGDRETDVEFARRLGARAVRLNRSRASEADFVTADAFEACSFIARASRWARLERATNETRILASVAIDGRGRSKISTGLKFFDHMLDQLSRHSGIDIELNATGDLQVDAHHTVEDTGIVLGETLRKALGDKRGIERFGFTAPLDEARADVVIDLSGRSYLIFNCELRREMVGDLPTELVEDFFRAFADGLRATLHVRCKGRNDHHKIEAIFKATARALKQAVRLDGNALTSLPSTKGKL